MVTNMISQLQESFPLRRAAGSGAAIIENGCPTAIFNYSFPLFIIASTFHFSTFQAEQKYVWSFYWLNEINLLKLCVYLDMSNQHNRNIMWQNLQ